MTKKKDYNAINKDPEAFEKFKHNFVIRHLRLATYKWPFKHMAKSLQRLDRGLYKCQSCQKAFGPKEIHVDHIEPIVNITGFISWDEYINKLFVTTDKMQVLCIQCHEAKSMVERSLKKLKDSNKSLTKRKKKGSIEE